MRESELKKKTAMELSSTLVQQTSSGGNSIISSMDVEWCGTYQEAEKMGWWSFYSEVSGVQEYSTGNVSMDYVQSIGSP